MVVQLTTRKQKTATVDIHMCIHAWVYMHVCIHAYVHIHEYVYIHECVYTCIRVYMHVYRHASVYTCTCVYMHVSGLRYSHLRRVGCGRGVGVAWGIAHESSRACTWT